MASGAQLVAAVAGINAPATDWHERLYTIYYKHFSHYDEDFAHIQLFWGNLTRLFTLWLQSKNLPVPEWTTTNPRLPAWATFLFDINDAKVITHVSSRQMGGVDENVASLMDKLYDETFAVWFEEAAAAAAAAQASYPSPPSEPQAHSHPDASPCTHDLELDFLTYTLRLASTATTSTTIHYLDAPITPLETLYNRTSAQAKTLLDHHTLASDARICPPLSISPSGSYRLLTIPWNLFHAFVATHISLADFSEMEGTLLPAMQMQGRIDFCYTATFYEEEEVIPQVIPDEVIPSDEVVSDSVEPETVTRAHISEVILLEIDQQEDSVRKTELQRGFDTLMRPWLEGEEVIVREAGAEERRVWEARGGVRVDERGGVWRLRLFGVLGEIEEFVMGEREGDVQ